MLSTQITDKLREVIGVPSGANQSDYITKVSALTRKYKNVTRLEDSLTESELQVKSVLFEAIDSHNILKPESTVVVWGSWYGSILIPFFANKSESVIAIDKDDAAIRFAKNKLFDDLTNIRFITDDVFATYRSFYLETNLIVNTACDYMKPMNEWTWFKHGAVSTDVDYPRGSADKDLTKKRVFNTPKLSSDCHFAFQSSDMFGVDGRTNAVRTLDEFKEQLPARAEIWFENETNVAEGKIFTLVGKLK